MEVLHQPYLERLKQIKRMEAGLRLSSCSHFIYYILFNVLGVVVFFRV